MLDDIGIDQPRSLRTTIEERVATADIINPRATP
jgi:hypothetical protein